ncbi:hypothetical protein BGZ58_001932 [Dissophora ornata]|nr:hypothetical protein BGZ58_001932 [Dissophora ornata]
MLMTTGSKMSGSVFSYLGSDPNAPTVKESGTSVASRDTMDGLRSTTATIPEAKSVVVGQVRRAPSSSESEPAKKVIVRHTTATIEIASHVAEHGGDAPKESTRDTSSKTAGTAQPPKASADLIDGALSDFDGSDLSDLSSASSASGSDHETEKEDEEDSSADDDDASDGSKDDEEEDDESMDDSSASDDSDSRSRSNSRHTKKSGTKNAVRSKHTRRIQSDSSDSEGGRETFKRKPGRPPKLKNNAVGSKAAQSPTSPVPTTFSNRAQAKKVVNGSSEGAEMEQVNSQMTVGEQQPKKKTKQPDFANVGKRDRSGRTQLFKYTAIGDLETCRKLIEAGAQVNDRDYAEWTPLHEACVTGHEKVAELLIQHHADVNARGGQMDTPLHDAAQNGHVEVVKLLLSHGANVLAKNAKGIIPMDVTDDKEVSDLLQRRQNLVNMLTGKNQAGQTLLHRACSSGSYSNAFELLNQGADINAKDNAEWTPLHEAALEGHVKIVELLLSRGADPNAQGHGNDTALHDSAQNEHEEVVKVLLEYGADPDFKNAKGDKPCDVTTNDDILGLLKTGARSTKKPLPRSAGSMVSSSSSLSSLSSQASKISSPSNQSKANDKAKRKKEGSDDANMSDDARSASEERPVQMSRDERKMQQLLSTIRMQEQMEERKKAKKRRPKQIVDDDGDDDEPDQKPVQSSVWKQSASISHHSAGRSISKSGKKGSKTRSSRSERDNDSDSEPSVKSRQSRRSVQRSAGDRFRIDHRYKDSAGRTQLHQWAESGDIEMVGTLLEGGAERDPKDHEGLTPLHLAAKAGNTEVLVLLLAYGCNVNAQDREKITALHEAVRHHHTEAVRLLLQNNATVSLRDSNKRTCFDLASPKDAEIRSLLKASMEQAELKTKERSKKRLSQCTESHGSPKHKERKTSRHSDNDEPVKSKKKDSDRRDIDEKKQHSRNGSNSGVISKSTSMPSIAVSQSLSSSSNTPASVTITNGSTGAWKYSNSDVNGDDIVAPLKKQKLHSRRMSSSGMSAGMQEGDDDVEMKSSGSSSKKRRESDRHGDGYGGKVKIKKEREEEGHFRAPSLSTKAEELRRVASLPSFSKDNNSNSNANGSSNGGSKASRHASKLSLSSSRPLSALGMSAGSSIASISPPLTETSSSPPPTSAQSLAAQEVEAQRSRKRSSQTFTSPSGYQKFADDLKLGSAASHQHHHRQRSATSIPTTRSAITPSSGSAATEVSSAAAETDLARKKAKMSTSELSTEYVNDKSSTKESTTTKAEESDKTSAGTEKIKKEEAVENQVPSERSVKDAQRYLPLYTVQLSSDGADSDSTSTSAVAKPTSPASQQQHFCVVDRQVQLLLGLAPSALFARYPHLHRRLVTNREKARLWSPLSSMVSDRCAAAVKLNFEILPAECQFSSWTNATTAMSRLKEHEKQKFLGCELYFIRLEEVIELIKLDYAQLNESMMTIALDIGYDEEELAMEVEEDDIKNNNSSTAAIKIEEKEEKVNDVKEEEGPDSKRPASVSLASSPASLSSSSVSAPASLSGTSGGGYLHKMRRVPAKMAAKAMFKEMQQQYRSS